MLQNIWSQLLSHVYLVAVATSRSAVRKKSTQRIALSLTIAGFLTACSGGDSEKLTKELKEVTSWTATARMVADAYTNGSVPSTYAARTFKNLSEELRLSNERMQQIQNSGQLAATTQQTQQIVSNLSVAAERHDLDALAQLTAELEVQQSALSAISQYSRIQKQ